MAEQNETQESIEEDLLEKTTARIEALGISSDDSLAEETDETEDSTSETETETESKDKDGDTETEQTEETDETEDSTLEDETEDSTSETETETESKDKDGDTETEQTESKIELPDAYYRAAVHRGWKPEEIKEFFGASPELAKRTFANIYEGVNQSSKEFADLGRLKLEQQRQPEKIKESPDTSSKGVDVDKLRETYGKEEPLVDVIVEMQKQNKLLVEQNEKQTSQQQTRVSDKELKVLGEQIDGFFADDDLKLYEDFYGPGKNATGGMTQPNELTPGNRANRAALLELGDQLIAGTALQGREISVSEALNLAHLSITAPIKEQKIREDIMSKVVKRSKSITLKGKGKKTVEADKPLSGTALESKTARAIKKLLRR